MTQSLLGQRHLFVPPATGTGGRCRRAEQAGVLRCFPLLMLAAALASAPLAAQMAGDGPAAAGSAAEPTVRSSLQIARAVTPVRIDGILDEAAWTSAQVVELPYETFPGDNVEPPVRTECRLTFDDQNLYLGCTAYDPRPELIRANYTDRDRALQDDHIILTLDPFGDQRRAFQFRVNPVGVQMDALHTQGSEDFSWDAIWSSAGRITADGYVVEMAIPFKSLRFPRSSSVQTWGFMVDRIYPRSAQHRIRSVRVDRGDTCLLCQAGRLDGLYGIAPGRDVEVSPTVTASRTDRRTEFPAGRMVPGEERGEVGMSLRWGVTPNLSFNAAVNPDFSQVEADVAQLTVNQRFALAYPEKRPFFLDGAEIFTSFANVVFTRTVVDPVGGVKLTGKEGPNAIGAFATRDRVTSLLFPGSQRSRSTLLEEEVATGVVRYQRDVGQSSTLGALYTGRSGSGYLNQVVAVDGLLRLSRSNTFRTQVMRSVTEYPEAVVAAFDQPEGRFSGDVGLFQFTHNSRNWNGLAQFQHLGGGYRADAGFLPRTDVRVLRGQGQRIVWGQPGGWYNRLMFSLFAERLTQIDGSLLDEGGAISVNYAGPRQTTVNWGVGDFRRVWNGQTFHLRDTQGTMQMQPSRGATFRLSGRFGEEIDFANTRIGHIVQVSPGVDLRLGRHLALDLGHTLQRLDTTEGEQIFEANLTQARVVYNFTTRAFVRGMLQYQDVRRNPDVHLSPVKQERQTVASQLLFSYKVNPQSVLFVGYTDDRVGEREFALTPENRALFMKLGYAWRL